MSDFDFDNCNVAGAESKVGYDIGLDSTGDTERNIASCEPRRGEIRRSFLAGNWNSFVVIKRLGEKKSRERASKGKAGQ